MSNVGQSRLNQSFDENPRPQELSKQSSVMTQLPSQDNLKLRAEPVKIDKPLITPQVKKGVEMNLQTDPIKPPTPPRGPIRGNRPIYIHVNCEADEETEAKVPLPIMVKPLPACKFVEMNAMEETEFEEEKEDNALDPISSRNNPLFKI